MKKIILFILLLSVIILLFSCDLFFVPVDTIRFAFSGTLVELTKGPYECGGTPVMYRNTSGDGGYVVFASREVTANQIEPDEYVFIITQQDSAGGFTGAEFQYFINGAPLMFAVGAVNGSIDTLRDTGLYCKGSFSGEITDDETGENHTIENGEFNVIRIMDVPPELKNMGFISLINAQLSRPDIQ